MWLEALGSLGIFLLGMIVMTEGLRALAGDTLRRLLIRYTRNPLSGALSGAACTAILQSSSATTVAAVGFVAANLLSFPAALGIIFGANLGTTITGWMVALLGFKLKLGLLALPLVFTGAALKLFAGRRLAAVGLALAGFGLIFVGISMMQEAMVSLRSLISFEQLPADTLVGRIKLIGLGIAFTIIAQSSSAGVAATLTALYAGMIDFEQAAALVIGMDVGTTFTALLATVGATTNARRTGLSHVVYNVITGTVALFLITPYVAVWETVAPGALAQHLEIGLVAFHSTFNGLGVIAALPFLRPFARLMERLVGSSNDALGVELDEALRKQPIPALNAVQTNLVQCLERLLIETDLALSDQTRDTPFDIDAIQIALDETSDYLDGIEIGERESSEWQRLVALLHTLDHLQRLHERLEDSAGFTNLPRRELIAEPLEYLRKQTIAVSTALVAHRWQDASFAADKAEAFCASERAGMRLKVMEEIGRGLLDVDAGTKLLDTIRWMARVSHHLARITHHLHRAVETAGGENEATLF